MWIKQTLSFSISIDDNLRGIIKYLNNKPIYSFSASTDDRVRVETLPDDKIEHSTALSTVTEFFTNHYSPSTDGMFITWYIT